MERHYFVFIDTYSRLDICGEIIGKQRDAYVARERCPGDQRWLTPPDACVCSK